MNSRFAGYAILSAAALLLAGCGGAARIPDDSYYRLNVTAPERSVHTLTGVLAVEVRPAAPIYRDRSLLYSDAPGANRLQRYHYHHWVDSPPRLLQHAVVECLQDAYVAQRVVGYDARQNADYRLRLVVERYEHLRSENAVLLQLSMTAGESSSVAQVQRFSVQQPVSGAGMLAVIKAYETAVTRVCDDLSRALTAN